MIVPRPYQRDAIESVFTYYRNGNQGNPIIAMPTGTGKSIVIALLIQKIFQKYADQRVLTVTHVKELIKQNFGKLTDVWPTVPGGVYSAGLKRKDEGFPITFGGVQSMYRKPELFGHVDLMFIDECHLVSPNQDTMYGSLIKGLREVNPHMRVIGLSATPYRTQNGMLTDGPIFTDLCFDNTHLSAFNELIRQGYLCKLRPVPTGEQINTEGLHTRAGEFIQKEVEAKVSGDVTYRIADEIVARGATRNRWLVYAVSIEHAERLADLLRNRGIECAALHSKSDDPDKVMEDFKAGRLKAVVSKDMLTTGVDVPEVDMLAVARVIRSPGLWVQILGRGTRPHDSKEDTLVLDFGGNTARLGPINDPVVPHKRKPGDSHDGGAPVKVCELCGTYVPAAARVCEHCGFEFPFHMPPLYAVPGTQEIVRDDPVEEWLTVDRVTYKRHRKEGKPDSLRVSYFCGLTRVTEWVCPAHGGFASSKANEWWKLRTFGDTCPFSVDGMIPLLKNLRTPKRIQARLNVRHPEVLGYEF